MNEKSLALTDEANERIINSLGHNRRKYYFYDATGGQLLSHE